MRPKPHLLLKDLWEYLNRYTYLPRLKNQSVLVKAVQAAVSGMLPGPFAYAERWDEETQKYLGLLIEKASNPHVVIDRDSAIVKPDVAAAEIPPSPADIAESAGTASESTAGTGTADAGQNGTQAGGEEAEKRPTRFIGTVMISAERPARDMHQIVEAIVEQLTTIPGSDVSLKLEIDAEVATGLDRTKVRTLIENATTLGFIDKTVK